MKSSGHLQTVYRFYLEERCPAAYRIGGLNVPGGRSETFREGMNLFHLPAIDSELVGCRAHILARVPNEILPDVLEK